MINAQHYYIWVQREHLRVYLGTVNGVSVSTAATIQTGEEASLEFVSTLPEYRRQGAAAGGMLGSAGGAFRKRARSGHAQRLARLIFAV